MDDDLSPPRPKKEEGVLAMKTMSGTSAGLQSRQDMVQEARKLKHKQDLAFKHVGCSLLHFYLYSTFVISATMYLFFKHIPLSFLVL